MNIIVAADKNWGIVKFSIKEEKYNKRWNDVLTTTKSNSKDNDRRY